MIFLQPGLRTDGHDFEVLSPISAACAAGPLLARLVAVGPAQAVEGATCRKLERRFDLIKVDIVPIQMNSALFAVPENSIRPGWRSKPESRHHPFDACDRPPASNVSRQSVQVATPA